MKIEQKALGKLLVVVSVFLLALLIFIKLNFDQQGALLCEAVYTDPTVGMDECPAHNNSSSWLLLLAFAIAFLIFAVGIYLLFTPRETTTAQSEKSFTEIDVSTLSEEEKRVYELLKFNKGSIYQGDLLKETGFSKVKLSRILDKMQNREILDRKRRGMANIVILK